MQLKRSGLRAATLTTSLFVALGSAALASGVAQADTTHDNYGIGNGNQINAPITIPINVCGNAIGILGSAEAGCKGGAEANVTGVGRNNHTRDNYGIGNGNQVDMPITAPINVCGNAGALLGTAAAGCEGGSLAVVDDVSSFLSHDNYGIGNGNQGAAPVTVPANGCGNSAGVLGTAEAGCRGGAAAWVSTITSAVTRDNYGIGNGNQGDAPGTAPGDLCGNAIGKAVASCEGGTAATVSGAAPKVKEMPATKVVQSAPGAVRAPSIPVSGPDTTPGLGGLASRLPVGSLPLNGLPFGNLLTGGGLPVIGGLPLLGGH